MFDRIFTFWEPRNELPSYLELCKRTWELNAQSFEIVVLDYSNINDYIGQDVFELNLLKGLPLMLQKDAIMVALLKEHGGIFIDIDTIALKDISPLMQPLSHSSELVMFDTHLAFLAAKPNAHILNMWYKGIQDKLKALEGEVPLTSLNWDYLGNSELARVMKTMLNHSGLSALPTRAVQRCTKSMKQWTRDRGTSTKALHTFLDRVDSRLLKLTFALVYRDYLTMLNRDNFIAESGYRNGLWSKPRQVYLDFWFDHDVNLSKILQKNLTIIGLHNSWTPDWYRAMNRQEILSHSCLLSKTLKHVLAQRHEG